MFIQGGSAISSAGTGLSTEVATDSNFTIAVFGDLA